MSTSTIRELLGDHALNRLRDLVGSRHDAMLSLVSAEGRVVWASEQGSRMIHGRDPQDVIGQPVDALVHESELAKVHGALSRALTGDTVSCDIWAANADGERRRVRLLLWPKRKHDHVIVITVANVLDPTAMGPP